MPPLASHGLKVFATCPQSKDIDSAEYARRVRDVARWSEAADCEGILVYTDNGIVDPWLTAQLVIQSTERLCPLVAVQPVYTHPYTVAKAVTSLAYLHGRRVYLNMLAGGFKNDLLALGDDTPHDERYDRTVEYTRIVLDLLAGERAVTVDGRYYRVEGLRLAPPLPRELMPDVLISGSSPAGLAAAEALGAAAVTYPRPPGEEQSLAGGAAGSGVRVGIIARDSAAEAWRVAHARFPEDRKGQIAHRLAMSVSDSHWHRHLSERDAGAVDGEPSPYWLGPFQNYKTFCPYLVGSYEAVAREVAGYVELGCSHFILDIPPSEDELAHTGVVLREALALLA